MKPAAQEPCAAARPEAALLRLLLALVGLVLLGDGLFLMALHHFHLGVVLPALQGVGFLLLSWQWQRLVRWRRGHARREALWRLGWCALVLWLLSLAWFWSRMMGLGVAPAAVPPVQAIVVLGSGTLDGQPRPALAARLDTAAELARLQPGAWLVVSGGIDLGAIESEGEIMARYLRERHGIRAERLLVEKASTSTDLNFALSRPMLQAHGVSTTAPTAVVTSDFHLMRAMRIARRQGLANAVPVAAPTPIATRYNGWLREYFAMLSSWILREL